MNKDELRKILLELSIEKGVLYVLQQEKPFDRSVRDRRLIVNEQIKHLEKEYNNLFNKRNNEKTT